MMLQEMTAPGEIEFREVPVPEPKRIRYWLRSERSACADRTSMSTMASIRLPAIRSQGHRLSKNGGSRSSGGVKGWKVGRR